MEQVQQVTTKGVIIKGKKVFMVLDQAKNWELPGGKIDFGEKPEEALAREFKEELHVFNVTIGKIFSVWEFTKKQENCECQYIVLTYKCEADLSGVQLSDEHSEYAWVGLNNMPKLQMRDGYRELIKQLFL